VPKSSAIDTPGGGIPKSGDLKAPLNPTVPQNPVAAAMTKAQQLANAGDPAGALKALKETYDADPKLRQLLVPMIELSQAYAMDFVNKKQETDAFPIFMESAQFARKLKEAGGQTLREKRSIANALYNEACVYTKTSKNDEALKSLEESIEQGLDDLKLLDTDTDMDPLRETEKFKELRA
jgi:tetratricopeptide (TPR) repeat protein